MIRNYSSYSKAIVAIIGTVATVLQTLWPSAHWATSRFQPDTYRIDHHPRQPV